LVPGESSDAYNLTFSVDFIHHSAYYPIDKLYRDVSRSDRSRIGSVRAGRGELRIARLQRELELISVEWTTVHHCPVCSVARSGLRCLSLHYLGNRARKYERTVWKRSE
jgi:hypothetical protein